MTTWSNSTCQLISLICQLDWQWQSWRPHKNSATPWSNSTCQLIGATYRLGQQSQSWCPRKTQQCPGLILLASQLVWHVDWFNIGKVGVHVKIQWCLGLTLLASWLVWCVDWFNVGTVGVHVKPQLRPGLILLATCLLVWWWQSWRPRKMSAVIYLTSEECLNLLHLSIHLVLEKSWENVPGGNLPTTTSILFHLPIHLSIYDIGEIAGECTRREPSDDIVINSSSPTHLSIYLSDIGEITGGWTKREPPAILSSVSFIYPYLFVHMGKCQYFIYICHLSIYLADIRELMGGCTRQKPPEDIIHVNA